MSVLLFATQPFARACAFESLTMIHTNRAVEVLIKQYRAARWCTDMHKASTFQLIHRTDSSLNANIK
ncbi:hypothetical protein SAMN04487897_112104 [Paenibacillus sp. yr247]|uniref:hypothetical protein n=1 Tax=Paenibacillus sp. yr247 TaxID=1761880 RepID=UPI000884E043|nr:hypothetical protein [Paenibacillus sp. yr247]SDO35335.1 hypothetical protein SAMN04487897_112104 [Paenibacillus sp. yr247]